MPGFNEIVKKIGTKKVNYLAIGRDDTDRIKEFLGEHPWQFDQVQDGHNLVDNVFNLTWGFPTTFLVDKNGKIVMAFSGKDDERASR
ncbi:MAG: redoxin domain-containing protein [Saprospiraceae bacterium]|nr:redoxin domain-containing protein [Saprospiraceae bacterium]